MDTKLCNDCGLVKPLTEFHANKAKPDGLQAYCKTCKKERDRSDYQKGRVAYVQKAAQNRQRCRDEVCEIKSKAGCAYCPETDPCCLEFHHVDRDSKEDDISRLMHKAARLKMLAEIKKCHIVCRNCHAKLHAGRQLLERIV